MQSAEGVPEPQNQFAARLERMAIVLYGDDVEHRYVPSLVNRIEKGIQPPTLQDTVVYEAVDPERRGRTWLAWGPPEEWVTAPVRPVMPEGSFQRAETSKSRAAKKAAAKRRRA